jgi:hypothetical protein
MRLGMTLSEIAAVLTSAAACLTSIGTLISSLRNARKIDSNAGKLDDVHAATTQLTTNVRDEAYAAGQKDSIDFITQAASELSAPPAAPRQTLGQAMAADKAANIAGKKSPL